MLRRHFLQQLTLVSAGTVLSVQQLFARFYALKAPMLKGKITAKGKGLAGVAVSDGYEIVQTNAAGEYAFQAHSNAAFVFVIIPSGYAIPHQRGIAQFYTPVRMGQAEQEANFALEPLPASDDRHAFIIWGDTQILDKEDAAQLNALSAPETQKVVQSLGTQPIHGIALGDLVFDKFDLYPDYKEAIAKTGIPFYQVIGNHDMDLGARSDEQSHKTYAQHFGPTWCSFNRGKAHYVLLDDVFMTKTNRGYMGYLNEAQLAWLEKDLALVPHGSLVIVSLHIPTKTGAARRNKQPESPGGMLSNRDVLYKMLAPYKAHIMSAHTHVNENWEEGSLMEHNHGTVCGAWWSGPVCSDGCPPGFAVYQVEGNDMRWYYHATEGGSALQLRLYKPGQVSEKPEAVVANIWNWDAGWKVVWSQDGKPMGAMERIVGRDPLATQLYLGPELPAKHKWVEPSLTDHLFAAVPTAGARLITVEATDRFGQVFTEKISLA